MKRECVAGLLALATFGAWAQPAPSGGAGTPGVRPGNPAGTVGSSMPGGQGQSVTSTPPGSGMGGTFGGPKATASSASSSRQTLNALADRNGEISRDKFLRYMADQYDAIARQRRGSVSTSDVRKILRDASTN
jgi:hypothetical protein